MDYTDYLHELESALGGNKIYPSIEDLMENEKCISTCGAVRVKIVLEEVLIGSRYGANDVEKEERILKLKQLGKREREKQKDDS